MKDQYFGDINDYLKYGILRLFSRAGFQIGICWMMTSSDGRTDGRKINYLARPERWRHYDPELFDYLVTAVERVRSVRQIQTPTILPNCAFYNDPVPDSHDLRRTWTTKALKKFSNVDLLFFDPDNGIEVRSRRPGTRGSSKFVYWAEIEAAWSQHCSLLIFQHFPRQNRLQYISRLTQEVSKRLVSAEVVPISTSNVVYIMAHQPQHKIKAQQAIDSIVNTWLDKVRTGTRVECL
jgi:hypothetical protein